MPHAYLRTAALALALTATGVTHAQDLHFSLLDFVPTWVNPALTGAYEGTARVGGLYRDQNIAAGNSRAYQTPSVYVDAPLLMLGKRAWLGVGGTLIQDNAGLARLNTTWAQGAASYHVILNENARRRERTVLSLGLQGGILARGADLSSGDIVLQEEQATGLGGGGLGQGGGMERQGDNFNASGFDLGLGASLARRLDAERTFRVGAAVRHLIAPDYALVSADANRPTTVSLQGAYAQLLSEEYLIEPQAFVQTTGGGFFAAQVQGTVGKYFGDDKRRLVKAGLGVRLPARFVYPMVGMDVGDLKIAAAFDISANQLQTNAEGFQRGFEIGVQYVVKIYKEPEVERVILCPQI